MSMRLTQALRRAAQQKPDALATIYGARRATFDQLQDRVARCANVLHRLGVLPGDRVALLSRNSDRHFEIFYGTWWAGCAINPTNTRWSPAEIAFSLTDCDTRVLFVDEAYAPMADALRAAAPCLRAIVFIGDGPPPEGLGDYHALMGQTGPAADAEVGGDAMAGVFYTGGTTGAPKGVVLSHTSLFVNALTGLAEGYTHGDARFLLVAPLFHMAGLFFLLTQVTAGGVSVIAPAFDPEQVMALIEREHVTHAGLVPTMIQMMVDHPRLPDFDLSSLTQIAYGASPISDGVLKRALDRLPRAGFIQAYGMTELGPLASTLPAWRHTPEGRTTGKLRSAGRAVPHAEIKVVDDAGEELPRGQAGELLVRGPGVMQGYWGQPELSATTLRGGWMHTGDVAYLDEDGYVFIVDRLKDMIISGGENVYSTEVENALSQHPAVAACAVIGVPDATWGERVHAVVVLKPGASATEADLQAHCHGLIAGYKCPRSIEFRPELPMSAASKILKTELRAPYWRNQSRSVA